jgi:membrane protein DedA with SNARE-associated domain
MSWISDHLLVLHGWTALVLVFLLPALEASIFLGFVFPGEIAVVVGGVLAYNGKVPLAGAIVAASLGAIVGDSVGYLVGKRWGDTLLSRLPRRFVKPEHVDQGKQLINRLGGRAVFVGRFAAALRALVPGLCGVSRMSYPKFLLWNMLGGVVWAVAFTMLGDLAGTAWSRVNRYADLASWGLLVVGVLAVAGVIVFNKRRQRAKDRATAERLAHSARERDAASDDKHADDKDEKRVARVPEGHEAKPRHGADSQLGSTRWPDADSKHVDSEHVDSEHVDSEHKG